MLQENVSPVSYVSPGDRGGFLKCALMRPIKED